MLSNSSFQITSLDKESSEFTRFYKMENETIINHILVRYHEVHRKQLNELIELASRVENVHKNEPLVPTGLCNHFINMQLELEQHMQKEEMILFPMLIKQQSHSAAGPIYVMQQEHIAHQADIDKVISLCHHFKLPDDACNSFQSLYKLTVTFIEDLRKHIHIENNILFARATALS